ncbi:MAG: metallophosphatase family protein [Gemmatimonadota bacterium]|nr:metallophosphatase family protein [Gemmatimonadota bacterium]
MRIAVLADVHGNLRALDVVLADIADHAPDITVNLGDCVSGPLDAAGTAERLMDAGLVTIRGNCDRQLVDRPIASMGDSDRAAASRLSAAQLAWLGVLPQTVVIGDVLLCHGTPSSDSAYLLESVSAAGARAASTAEVRERLHAVSQALVLCAHSHIPRSVDLAEGRMIVNPGSVGLPAYSDDTGFAHVMETGTPHARYAIVERRGARWHVHFRVLEYDWDAAASDAYREGRNDWAHALATGRAIRHEQTTSAVDAV